MNAEIQDLRLLDASRFASLLEAESRVWHSDLRWDFTAATRQISSCLKEKSLSGYALLIEHQVRAYCFFFEDENKALIGDLFTDLASSDIDQARRLLDQVLDALLRTPGSPRVEAQLPHFSLEQLEPCFRSRGFQAYRRRFMAAALTDPRPCPAPTGGRAFQDFFKRRRTARGFCDQALGTQVRPRGRPASPPGLFSSHRYRHQ